MNYILFDLEWNRYVKAVKKHCPDEIIQIGAVKYNSQMKCVGTFNRFVAPVLYKKIEPTITKLTNLDMSFLKREGVPFAKAIKDFKAFIGTDAVLMSWGSQDAQILRRNCHYFNPDAKLSFMKNFVDVQRYVTHVLTSDKSGGNLLGVKIAADIAKIPYREEQLHDALIDATVSGLVFAKTFHKKTIKRYIVDASNKACDFKDTPILDMNDKMVDKQMFKVRCPKCGRYMRRKHNWALVGNKFAATHFCRKCRHQYLCSIEILRAYGNVVKYKKRIRLSKPEKNAVSIT